MSLPKLLCFQWNNDYRITKNIAEVFWGATLSHKF